MNKTIQTWLLVIGIALVIASAYLILYKPSLEEQHALNVCKAQIGECGIVYKQLCEEGKPNYDYVCACPPSGNGFIGKGFIYYPRPNTGNFDADWNKLPCQNINETFP